jgi:hypothetical protein
LRKTPTVELMMPAPIRTMSVSLFTLVSIKFLEAGYYLYFSPACPARNGTSAPGCSTT